MRLRHVYMAEAGDTGGEGGGSGAGTGEGAGNKTGASTPDHAAQIAALTAQVTGLTADKAKSDKAATDAATAAETARVANLTAAEKLAEERASLTAQGETLKGELAAERKALATDARNAAVDKLGVLSKFRNLAPDVDPRTPEGAKALELWAKENPELLQPKGAPGYVPPAAPPESRLGKILNGTLINPYMPREAMHALIAKITG